jgi:oxaloacetate decarboxylase (Na+ extruding) subunit gamma
METSLLLQGVQLMLVGMGTVFVFLTLLVFATRAMSALVLRWQPRSVTVPPGQVPGVSDDEIAAITAAISAYRRGRP